jgi:alkylation response protein AidB-like acyl-CoA dehydrogenase
MSGSAMSFALTDEQQELRRTVRAFLDAKASESEVRRVMDTPEGYDPSVWRQMADQLGLLGLATPEEFGGQGFRFFELGIVMEEIGRALLPGPYLASIALAASALLHSGDDAVKQHYLPDIASGRTIATVAVTEESGRWGADGIHTRARCRGDSWTLDGTKMHVLDGHIADLFLVAARTDEGISLFAVDEFHGVSRRALSTLDQTRRQARVEFYNTPATLVGRDGEAWSTLERTLALGSSALAAEQVGGAQRCLDMAVDYAKVRKQFGKPIGSFQAIRHKCADVFLEVECARGAAYYALQAAAGLSDELVAAAALAKAFCSDAFGRAAAANIQIHGGIGFTWEHPAHLYFKRARSSGQLLGDAEFHRGLLADRVGL